VNRLFKGEKFEHKIEVLKTAEHDISNKGSKVAKEPKHPRGLIAQMAAQKFKTGMNCNLGVGLPQRRLDLQRAPGHMHQCWEGNSYSTSGCEYT
jgi:hypothetical protein